MVVSRTTSRSVSVPTVTPSTDSLRSRVEAVGPRRFGVVTVDCAKHSSRWRLADFFGHCLIPPTTVDHRAADFNAVIQAIQQARCQHLLGDLIVVLERTGRYHLPLKRAFAAAGFEVRIVDPLATHQFRKPVHAGNKTDDIDLEAIHAAAVHGFGLVPVACPQVYLQLQDWARHRRDLVTKTARLRCQIREQLHSLMPGYAELFNEVFLCQIALFVPLAFTTAALRAIGPDQLAKSVKKAGIRSHKATRDSILAWARVAPEGDANSQIRQTILADLIADLDTKRRQIAHAEIALARLLLQIPHLILLSIPGLNVVTTAEFAAEAGPMAAYASGRAITGRAGLYPSRYQSGLVDLKNGPLVPKGNRRLRHAILRIADTLMRCNDHFRLFTRTWQLAGKPKPRIHIAIGGRFTRIAFRMVSGGQTYRHPSSRQRDSIIPKLIKFYESHHVDITETMSALQTAVDHLPASVRSEEVQPLQETLTQIAGKRGAGPKRLGEILPSVVARLMRHEIESTSSGELSQPV